MNVALGSPVRKIRTPGSAGGGRRKEQSAQGRPLPTTRIGDTRRSAIFPPRSSSGGGGSSWKFAEGAFRRRCSVQPGARMSDKTIPRHREASEPAYVGGRARRPVERRTKTIRKVVRTGRYSQD